MTKNSSQRGFTLVEVLAALAMLSVAIVPTLFLSTSSLDISFSIRNNLIAANLAQEGVEVVRAIRDANWFNSVAYDSGLTTCTTGCRVEYKSSALSPLGVNPVLTLNPSTGVYFYPDLDGSIAGSVDSIFKRTITITSVSAVELKVTSAVSWTERGRAKNVTVEDHLFNWK